MKASKWPGAGRGLTLIEACVVMTILGALAAVALPAVMDMQHHHRLRSATEILAAELRLAQSESLKRQHSVSLNVRSTGPQWCYGYSIASSCDCTQPGSCTLDGIEKVRQHIEHRGVQLHPHVSGNRFSFQPVRGTVTAGHVTLTAANGTQLRVVVSGLGRIRVCTPSGAGQHAGYPVC